MRAVGGMGTGAKPVRIAGGAGAGAKPVRIAASKEDAPCAAKRVERDAPLRREARAMELVAGVRGQMTIELAAALPVLLAVALLATNALVFFGQCAVFDRAAHQAVRVHAAAPAYGQGASASCALAEADIRQALGGANVEVSVTCSAAGRDLERYTATLVFSPSLFGYGLRSQAFGVQMPRLTHTTEYVVDSYKPGVIV